MSSPIPVFGMSNNQDDDAQVIDSMVTTTAEPPEPPIEPITIPPLPALPTITRVLAGTELITTDRISYQLLPPDANRREFELHLHWGGTPGEETATDYILLSDEIGKVSNTDSTQGAMRIYPGKEIDLDAHTGAIWLNKGPSTTATLIATWRAVTS
jgi:hypothetical protein